MVPVATAALLAGCSGNGKPPHLSRTVPRLSVDTLLNAHKCPVDLAAAARAAGLKPDGSATHSVTSGDSTAESASAVAQAAGIDVECSQKLSPSGAVELMLLAVDRGSAANLTLPYIAQQGKLGMSDVSQIGATAAKTKVGSLVDLPSQVPGALGIVAIKGKKSAAFTVFGSSVSRDQARTIANKIDDQLF